MDKKHINIWNDDIDQSLKQCIHMKDDNEDYIFSKDRSERDKVHPSLQTFGHNSPLQSEHMDFKNSSLYPEESEILPQEILGAEEKKCERQRSSAQSDESDGMQNMSPCSPEKKVEEVVEAKQDEPKPSRTAQSFNTVKQHRSSLRLRQEAMELRSVEIDEDLIQSVDKKKLMEKKKTQSKETPEEKRKDKSETKEKTERRETKKIETKPDNTRKKEKAADRLSIRRIPSQLYASYDELNLTIDQQMNPPRFKEKPKDKQKPKREDFPPLIDEEMFASLPILEGYCSLIIGQSIPSETKFIIIKDTIIFQIMKKIFIDKVKKIKLLEKEGKLFVKINHSESHSDEKDDIYLFSVLSASEGSYFSETYNVYSQLVMRKLLLMNLFINKMTEKHGQQNENEYRYEAELFKKAQFFNTWEKRKLTLEKNVLKSFKGNKCSYEIDKIFEVWTRFQMINGYLVIKVWHKMEKVQLGIPLMDFTDSKSKSNWLYGISRIVSQSYET